MEIIMNIFNKKNGSAIEKKTTKPAPTPPPEEGGLSDGEIAGIVFGVNVGVAGNGGDGGRGGDEDGGGGVFVECVGGDLLLYDLRFGPGAVTDPVGGASL